jgi:hypothetical protein
LSRSQYTNTRDEKRGDSQSNSEFNYEHLLDPSDKIVNISNITEISILKAKHKSMVRQQSVGSIKINSSKQFDSIFVEDAPIEKTNIQSNHVRASSVNLPKLNGDEPNKLSQTSSNISPIDQYNMDILRSRDWGRVSGNGGFLPVINHGSKPSLSDIHSSLGYNKAKLPRERVLRQKDLIIAETLRLPPPMIGRTIGHGIKGGYNPSEMEINVMRNVNILPASVK